MFSTRLSAAVLLQYGNEDDALRVNARLRYNPREGVDLWLVYDEVDLRGIHASPADSASVEGRSVMLKFSYTLLL